MDRLGSKLAEKPDNNRDRPPRSQHGPPRKRQRHSTSPHSSDSSDNMKRARTDDSSDEELGIDLSTDCPTTLLTTTNTPMEVVHDPDYYFSDGSCVLRVEDTLFNVHRTFLSRDSSAFKTLLSLPPGDKLPEGGSDDNPITLSGDTVEEFRDLLWSLYSLPHELMIVHTDRADVSQLINIALKANKYGFKSLEAWALDAIQDLVTLKPSPVLASLPASTKSASPEAVAACGTQITRLVRLAQLCAHARLLESMVAHLRHLMAVSLRFAYLALELADELDLRALRGAAYLEVLQKAAAVAPASECAGEVPGTVDDAGRLRVTRPQQLRLLGGYYQLTATWERLRGRPPGFEHASSCGATWHQHGCTQSWLEFWKDKSKGDSVLGLGLADVLGRLRAIQKEFDRWGSATYMHHDCRQAARNALQDQVKRIEDSLPDFFSGDIVMG